MLGERGTRDSHKQHPDLAGSLPCGPSAHFLLQFTKTAALTLAGGKWMDPWPKASCRMLVGAIGEWDTQGAHRLHPDLAGPLPCCPGALTPWPLSNTATLTRRSPGQLCSMKDS
ncbi:hypothetical protein NDU88_006609 [Pleurodeles waltl]|uniref:Uncharacterized protein n=1 Tax=Pleurodeles waltl TaxID=8319 RepID=A0AAV7X361_PLEWA|nr:hypothetical protein NDU88_006609 [Pleurodeles waltl]